MTERFGSLHPAMASRLILKNIEIDILISSPAKRALTTAGYFAKAYNIANEKIILIPSLYEPTSEAFLNALPWLLLALFYLMLLPRMYRSMARKALENDPSLRGGQIRTIDELGLHVQGAGFTQDLSWADLVRVVESPEFFLFFYNKRVAHYAPKRAFSPAAIADVQGLVRTHAAGRFATI